MKRAFTLIELLVTVTVIVILAAFVFRLGNVIGSASARNETANRIQRLENALSGYYAAFGVYPPVNDEYGSRDYTLTVKYGMQNEDDEHNDNLWNWYDEETDRVTNPEAEGTAWEQVKQACLAQPVRCEFPFPGGDVNNEGKPGLVKMCDEGLKKWADESEYATEEQRAILRAGVDDGVTENIGRHTKNKGEIKWRKVQLFKFGLFSYLLPRYLLMMNGDRIFFTDYQQWIGNNDLPADPLTGERYNSWNAIREQLKSKLKSDLASVANIPSQAVCARWMANFEHKLLSTSDLNLYGIDVSMSITDLGWSSTMPRWKEPNQEVSDDQTVGQILGFIYNPAGYRAISTSGNYILDGVTMVDGWGEEIFYYSPAPYQSYVVWSAGPNGRTFPPWVAREKLSSNARKCIGYWTRDDIIGLSK